ncbi:MAG: tetratricopeptide repeat protein [Opitutae bacterium]|nr:tetratricopeptide repeat protein [Opitutae bacterium]
MSESSKAVFLSYASQDAEAAKRIADALRSAGVEVWFDQSELRGGDAWDAMIRKRIKECALFVPIITPNTNARAEGYFRLEWKLAVDRSHLMADDAPFLFPIVIGDVADATARVPDKFRDVQWTRLRLDETPAELAARVARLLSGVSGVGGALRPDSSKPSGHKAPPTGHPGRWQWWMIFPILGMIVGLKFAAVPLWRSFRGPAPKPVVTAQAPDHVSEARQLAQKAAAMSVDKYSSTADDYAAAEGLLKRALELEQNDAEIWAISSMLHTNIRTRGFDHNRARREWARRDAERAVKLDPNSQNALFALGRAQRDTDPVTAEATFQKLLSVNPQNADAMGQLAWLYDGDGRVEEAIKLYDRVLTLDPADAPLNQYVRFLLFFHYSRFAEAEQAIRRSVEMEPSANSCAGLVMLLLTAKGDAEESARVLATVPAAFRNEPRIVWVEAMAQLCRRDPEAVLRTLQRLQSDYIQDNWFAGPKAYFAGLAHAMAGRAEAARVAWQSALAIVDTRLKETPDNPTLHLCRGQLLAWLGQTDEARREARLLDEMRAGRPTRSWFDSIALIHAAVGDADKAMPLLEQLMSADNSTNVGWPLTRALLRFDPRWDKLRADSRFQKLCAEPAPSTESDSSFAKATEDWSGKSSLPDQKSVAVLAFANLSDDKANEYFSDGISEELLNVLAKIPNLKVSARTSAFYFKGKEVPVPEIAKQLGVAYVVEGSVRKAGDKVRITAQLIKAADGFHVWSDTFTRDLKDIFAVQDEIAGLIARQLQLKLGEGGARVAVDPALYELLLQARALTLRESNEDWRQAIALYRRALERESRLALAWAEMARTYVQLGRFGGMPTPLAMREARPAAQRALELEPDLASGLVALGWVQRTADWDWRGARRSFQRALELAPGNSSIMGDLAVFYFNTGRVAEAKTLARQAVERDPLNARAQASLGFILNLNGDWEQALAPLEQAVALAPAIEEVRSHKARALSILGRQDEAAAAAEQEPNEAYRLAARAFLMGRPDQAAASNRALSEFIAKYGDDMPGYVANIYAIRGEVDPAFVWLERAYGRRDAAVVWVKTNANCRSLHSDPRWPGFLRKVGLADDQLN